MADKYSSPCQHCKSRYLGCHDECADFKDYRSKKDNLNNALKQGKAREDLVNSYKVDGARKLIKRKGERTW